MQPGPGASSHDRCRTGRATGDHSTSGVSSITVRVMIHCDRQARGDEGHMDLWKLDATDLARLIRTGQASAVDAVDSVLGRLHKVNPAINAVVRVFERDARTAAETADA